MDAWTMAHIRKVRKIWTFWTLLQLCGVVLLFFYPLGTIAGLTFLLAGFALSATSVCSRCGNPVDVSVKKCPHCKEALSPPRTSTIERR